MSFALPSPLDRITASVRALIFGELPALRFAGIYEYSVTGTANGTIDAHPVDPSLGLPPLSNLSLEPSALGEGATTAAGNLCLVEFVNGNPSRPEVVSLGPTNAAGILDCTGALSIGPSASAVNLGAAQAYIARTTDTASVYFPEGTTLIITGVIPSLGAALLCTVKLVDAATQTIPLPCLGILGPGSAKVFA